MDNQIEATLDEQAKTEPAEAFFKKWAEGLFYKLVALHRWSSRQDSKQDGKQDARLLPTLALLARDASILKPAMEKLEADHFNTEDGKPAPAPSLPSCPAEVVGEWEKLWSEVAASRRLHFMFASAPLLSVADARIIATLAPFADISADELSPSMIGTRDPVFEGVLELVLPPRDLADPEQLLAEHTGKCLLLINANAPFAQKLDALASTPHWPDVLALLEKNKNHTDDPASEADKILSELWSQSTLNADLQAMLGSAPRLSQIPPDLFNFVFLRTEAGDLDELRKLLPASGSVGAQIFAIAGNAALKLYGARPDPAKKTLGDLRIAAKLRLGAARSLVEVRKRAKVETLLYKWPQAARLARSNPRSIVNVENYLSERNTLQTAPPSYSDEERELYALCESDSQFTRFLRLRPYFDKIPFFQQLAEIPPSQLPMPKSSTPMPAVTTATQQSTPPVTQQPAQTVERTGNVVIPPAVATPDGRVIAPIPDTQTVEKAATVATVTTQSTPTEYETFILTVTPLATPDQAGNVQEVSITQPGLSPGVSALIPPVLIKEVFEEAVGPLLGGADPQTLLSRMFSRVGTEYLPRAVRAGRRLYRGFFSGVEKVFDERLAGSGRSARFAAYFNPDITTRIVIDAPEFLMTSFPWELLACPSQDRNFVLSANHSLVRSVPRKKDVDDEEIEMMMNPPLRILSVLPSYKPEMRNELEKRVIQLHDMFDKRGAKTEFLWGEPATPDRLSNVLFEFSPHILHFEGQIFAPTVSNTFQSGLMLAQGDTQRLELKKLLRTAGVRLLVLQNSAFFPPDVPTVFNLTEDLVHDTLPAALAPVRAIEDTAAVEFMRAFYGALLDGNKLEAAVGRARVELFTKGGGDWSAYALFSNVETLLRSHILPSLT